MLLGPESLPFISRVTRSLARRAFNWSQRFDTAWVRREVRKVAGRNALQVRTYTQPWELNALYKLAATCAPNSQAIEIGSHLGGSACYIAAGLRRIGGRLVCVDTWKNDAMPHDRQEDTFATFLANTALLADRITVVRKNSKDLTDTDLSGGFAFGFIDGDHTYEGALCDFNVVAPRINPGGVLAFHDSLTVTGVGRVIGGALATGTWVLSGQVLSLTWLTKV